MNRLVAATLLGAACLSTISEASLEPDDLRCVENGMRWEIQLQDGTSVGKPMSEAECQQSIASAHVDLVCTATDSSTRPWRPTHTISGVAMGRFGTSLADCTELTANASEGLVCTNTGTYSFQGRKPTYFDDGPFTESHLLGASGQQAYCVQATREARNGEVCACNGDFCGKNDWILYHVATKRPIGRTTDLRSCIDSQTP